MKWKESRVEVEGKKRKSMGEERTRMIGNEKEVERKRRNGELRKECTKRTEEVRGWKGSGEEAKEEMEEGRRRDIRTVRKQGSRRECEKS